MLSRLCVRRLSGFAETLPGGRNHALNVAAFNLGRFVPHRLCGAEVEAVLFSAGVESGLPEDEVRATLASGLRKGMEKPCWDGLPSSPANDFENVAPCETNLDKELERLARLSPLEYDRLRAETAERLSVRVSTLDNEVAKRRREPASQIESIGFLKDPVTWSEPVDGAELLAEMVARIRRHIVLPDLAAETMALWTLHAHAHDAAVISPILAFESPEKRCGKTTAMNLVASLVPKALPTANITAAALFRAVEKFRPTLLLDEADTFLKDNDDLRGVLNSGHNRRSAHVVRTVGDEHEPKCFSTWAPKAIAIIGDLPDTLQDRAIAIRLRRKLAGEVVESLRGDRTGDFDAIQSRAARWVEDHMESLRRRDAATPSELNDRAADNWRALLAIADEIGGTWPVLARRAALGLSGPDSEAKGEPSDGVRLLRDIREVFDKREGTEIEPGELAGALITMPESPWMDYGGASRLPPRALPICLLHSK
jgi:Protein of unknown function (DUF3631).